MVCADVDVGVTYEVLVLPCTSVGCTEWEDRDWPWAQITIPYRLAPGMVQVFLSYELRTIMCNLFNASVVVLLQMYALCSLCLMEIIKLY